MGAQPDDHLDDSSFTLLNHIKDKLTNKESAQKIAQHFASISQEYSPIDIDKLPEHVRKRLDENGDEFGNKPFLEEFEIYKKICSTKKTKSGVPGDMPEKLVSEFAPELAKPLAKVFNKIVDTGKWPAQWKIEHGIPLQKVNNPETEDDVRVISLTPFFSKVMEKFIIDWLLRIIGDKIDWHQYGGQKGNGVTHYLIEFVNFIQYNQDLRDIHATLAVFIDFSKAFNRQDHNILVTLLCDLGQLEPAEELY